MLSSFTVGGEGGAGGELVRPDSVSVDGMAILPSSLSRTARTTP